MPPEDPDRHSDLATASVSLATEAALLDARLRMLREAIDTVDAHIEAVSDALRLLRRTPSASARAADNEDHCGSPGRQDADDLTDEACQERATRSMPC